MREPDDGAGGDARRRAGTYGRASGHGQVYQSAGDQYVTHVNITAEGRGLAAHEARERADVVVQVLARAVGEWAARCQELEEKARRAKAEGRAEAHAEFTERLRDAELRVMRAQSTMRQAEEERARAEALLAQAQQELARRRRGGEQDRDDEDLRPVRPGPPQDERDAEEFSDLLERAEAELGAVREGLRQLGEETGTDPARVVAGEWTRRTAPDRHPAPARPTAPPAGDAPARPVPAIHTTGLPLWGPVGAIWALLTLPPWVPMLVVTTNRAAYAATEQHGDVGWFTAVTVVAGLLAYVFLLGSAGLVAENLWLGDRERKLIQRPAVLCVLVSLLLLVAAFFTPLHWPGPAGAWGRGLASLIPA
ncbi:hypothetical protein RKD26_005104 [Streptomyces calvus]|uniref:hypothetical protein n=1 Tax=Streptomyces calvus TaxID=67282 RepID=UPI003518303F